MTTKELESKIKELEDKIKVLENSKTIVIYQQHHIQQPVIAPLYHYPFISTYPTWTSGTYSINSNFESTNG